MASLPPWPGPLPPLGTPRDALCTLCGLLLAPAAPCRAPPRSWIGVTLPPVGVPPAAPWNVARNDCNVCTAPTISMGRPVAGVPFACEAVAGPHVLHPAHASLADPLPGVI